VNHALSGNKAANNSSILNARLHREQNRCALIPRKNVFFTYGKSSDVGWWDRMISVSRIRWCLSVKMNRSRVSRHFE